jgi:DNA invertase Pin-like site-specific DNA recombinase
MGIGAYLRISEDITGTALGVERQREDCLKLADMRRWTIDRFYVDNDLSAYKTNVVRPDFEQLLRDLSAGVIEGVVTWDLDRFVRQPSDLERTIRIYDERPGLLFSSVQSDFDLGTSDGRTMARVLVAFANKASMDTSRRVKRKQLELAMNGVPVGGVRPFGYQADKATPHPAEAALIRQARDDILAGVTLHAICRRWNQAGITTTRGGRWKTISLRKMLANPRNAGFRVHSGEIALHADGKPVMGKWQPLMTVDEWEEISAFLEKRKKGRVRRHNYLLSGVARCGVCGKKMGGNQNTRSKSYFYTCRPAHMIDGACGSNSIIGPKVDALVGRLVATYLAETHIAPVVNMWDGAARLEEIEDQIGELMMAYRDKQLPAALAFANIQELEQEAEMLRSEKVEWLTSARAAHPIDVSDWDAMTLEQQQAAVRAVLSSIVIRKASRPREPFDRGRVVPVWKVPGQSPFASDQSMGALNPDTG